MMSITFGFTVKVDGGTCNFTGTGEATCCPALVCRDRSVEHIRLICLQLIPNGLEVEPADIFAAHMLAAIAGAVIRDMDRLDPGRCDIELLLAAPFERDKPESGGFNAMAAGG